MPMPQFSVDIPFSVNQRPRRAVVQSGSTRRYQRRPNYSLLTEYEQAVLTNPTLKAGLDTIIETLISMMGQISHPDPDIQAFCRYSLEHMEVDYRRRFYESIHTAFWSGSSVSEILFKADRKGNLVHDDIMCYHPSTIMLRVNKRGRLTENEPAALEGYKSGIYQVGVEPNMTETQIPRWKSIYLVNDPRYNNVHGNSMIAPAYKYHLLKETYEDMMTTALDRYGHPLIWVKVPGGYTDDTIVDPATGEERQLTVQEAVERDMANLSGGNVLVFSQTNPDVSPDVRALTTGNNIGDTFLTAIQYCDNQVYRSLLIPFIVLGSDASRLSSAGAAERQMELFSTIMRSLFKRYVGPFSNQLFSSLIKRHFNRDAADIPPHFPVRQITRPEERVSMMQMIVGLTESGYFNPQNEEDWNMVRQFVDATDRDYTEEDAQYVEDMVVGPRQRNKTSGKEEGPIRGKPGRPKGSSAPQMKPR